MRTLKVSLIFVLGALLLLVGGLLSLAIGAKILPGSTIVDALFSFSSDDLNQIIVRQRVPRTLFAVIAGASLGVSGTLMQSITRNPVADPGILGVNMGAALSVVCGIAFFDLSTPRGYIWFALVGAGVTAFFVYLIGSLGFGGPTPIKLALSGAAISAALSSLISAIMIPRSNVMNTFRFWQVGSLSGSSWEGIFSVLPFIFVALLIALFLSPSLNALALGDSAAKGLGVNTNAVRLLGAFSGVILCGATTALAGPIGFIGLMIPHGMRLVLGPDHRILIPATALYGSILLLLADIIGRTVSRPGELEAGLVTAFLGAPVFIYIAKKAKVKAL